MPQREIGCPEKMDGHTRGIPLHKTKSLSDD